MKRNKIMITAALLITSTLKMNTAYANFNGVGAHKINKSIRLSAFMTSPVFLTTTIKILESAGVQKLNRSYNGHLKTNWVIGNPGQYDQPSFMFEIRSEDPESISINATVPFADFNGLQNGIISFDGTSAKVLFEVLSKGGASTKESIIESSPPFSFSRGRSVDLETTSIHCYGAGNSTDTTVKSPTLTSFTCSITN